MKKKILKQLLFFGFIIFSASLKAQETAPDEDTGPYTTCNPEGENETRTSNDLPNPVNVGTIDDRSCYANYKETTIDGTVWGIYNITAGSNNQDTNGLQPRIERSLDRSQTSGVGSYARFTGTVRILEVAASNRYGSYIMQAKGKHSGGGGSPDPAICLFIAIPVFGRDENGKEVQVSFDLYREQINYRGASFDRDNIFLTNIQKNVPTDIQLEVGFREDPNDSTKKIHYADAVIGGEVFNWNIPEPERGLQSGIRYGAYRVWGGRAQIRWANTTYEKKEVLEEVEENENQSLIGKTFSLKNVATGKFLTHLGDLATPVIMSDTDESFNSHWSFVERGSFFNIDSNNFGVLRGTGPNFVDGAYKVVSTEREPPVTDNDKSWIIHYNESDNTYRFESGSARYLYHQPNGDVTHLKVSENDDRSKWELIEIENPLNVTNKVLSSFHLFPNPANKKFTIQFKNNTSLKRIKIYNFLGQKVYQNSTFSNFLSINSTGFEKGVYLVKISSNSNNFSISKLVIK